MNQTPTPNSHARFSDDEVERYARHLILSEVGGPGQQALKKARVLVVGMGGIGNPAALYLAAAGVGHLGLIDEDVVSLSNLQRQVIFGADDIGKPKVAVAKTRLNALNPHTAIEVFNQRITPDNARELIGQYDVVLDGTDDFDTRFCVNAACVQEGKPLVSGALGRWTGQVGVFTGQPCYQCLVPEVPPEAETCARVGIIGALAGVIGTMTALETLKIITGAGQPLISRLLIYDGLEATSRVVRLAADPECPVCSR